MFLIDNVMTSDPTSIANKFNTFFAEIGVRLSENVNNIHNIHFTDYLLNPSMYNYTFELITEETTMEILNNLKPKPSCGYDGISTKLLKTFKLEICKSLTLIINQTLPTGIFPDSLKVAKVIPLYKKGDKALLGNYRPISILPSISKYSKGLFLIRSMTILHPTSCIITDSTDSEKNIQLNLQLWNS